MLPPYLPPKTHSLLEPFFDRTRGKIEPGSHRIQKLLTPWLASGILEIPCCLVTGSNGKGGTCAYIEQALRDHGLKTGLYTSPHLVNPQERIRINGIPVQEKNLVSAIEKVNAAVEKYLPNASFFEILTAVALIIFSEEKVDFLVCEVGLGGHFDSTNALAPCVSILTSVSLEHTDILGKTLLQIASDKSYIARRNLPFVVGNLDPEALEGVKATIQKIGANLIFCETNQLPNKYLALKALDYIFAFLNVEPDPSIIKNAISQTFWPGRFDVRKMMGKTVIFDAAHNSAGVDYFLKQYQQSNFANQKCIILFSSLKDKDWQNSIVKLLSTAHFIVVTTFASERAVTKENYIDFIKSIHEREKIILVSDFEMALEKCFAMAKNNHILITGSLAFLGTVMERLNVEVFPS